MTTFLRPLFKGSNRRGHLNMSFTVGLALGTIGPLAEHQGWISLFPAPELWLVSMVACWGQELWASSDRDEEEKRKPGSGHYYWLRYGKKVKHRTWASHGLIIGTVIRGVYGWWPLILALIALGTVAPFVAAWLAVAVGVGWLANDLGHIALDW